MKWGEVVEEVKIWIHNLLLKGFDNIEPYKNTSQIKLPVNIGCPNANPPKLNLLSSAALRMYFGNCTEGAQGRDYSDDKYLTLVGYGLNSATTTVGTVPDMVKCFPIQEVECLQRALNVMNELLHQHPHTNIEPWDQISFNHIEIKFYFGSDIVCQNEVVEELKHLSGKDAPMREVGWHCDWVVGLPNSQQDGSYVFSLSLGEARTISYRQQEKIGGRWNDCKPVEEYTSHHRLEHGSLNILDPKDESGADDTRFQHRGFFGRNTQTKVEGKGISVVIVFRSCPPNNTVQVHGPKQKKPFVKVCTEQELVSFNQRQDGNPKRFMGTNSNAKEDGGKYWYETCHKEALELSMDVKNWISKCLHPKLKQYLSSSELWKKRNTMEDSE